MNKNTAENKQKYIHKYNTNVKLDLCSDFFTDYHVTKIHLQHE